MTSQWNPFIRTSKNEAEKFYWIAREEHEELVAKFMNSCSELEFYEQVAACVDVLKTLKFKDRIRRNGRNSETMGTLKHLVEHYFDARDAHIYICRSAVVVAAVGLKIPFRIYDNCAFFHALKKPMEALEFEIDMIKHKRWKSEWDAVHGATFKKTKWVPPRHYLSDKILETTSLLREISDIAADYAYESKEDKDIRIKQKRKDLTKAMRASN